MLPLVFARKLSSKRLDVTRSFTTVIGTMFLKGKKFLAKVIAVFVPELSALLCVYYHAICTEVIRVMVFNNFYPGVERVTTV